MINIMKITKAGKIIYLIKSNLKNKERVRIIGIR